ncbi:MAG TPA: hypothetical protein VGP99_07835, partial [Tepidisphaeraceae bacterium]|nr:hypothetical protein [Tepidisphaeraceae bacterium]
MGEICAILGVVLVVVLLVAVVGHVFWLILASLFRLITGGTSGTQPPKGPMNLGDEAITARKLQQLYRAGQIDQETFQKVLGAMQPQNVGQRPVIPLAHPPPKPPPPPVAVEQQPSDQMEEMSASDEWMRSAPTPPPIPPLAAPFRVPPPKPRQVIPIEPVAPPPPPPPAPPRKPFSEILKRFMEESNIRWGELIGGLLIIGCSIALVLTFWEQIATQPWLRFFLFTAVTSAVFGTGLYTEHRWKLPTTSRGLLLIASLLVPLNFLAFSRGGASSSALAQELVAVALFAWLVWMAGKVLAGRWAIPLAIGVLGPSII